VIEAGNLLIDGSFTPLAWDIARNVSKVLQFKHEIIIEWLDGACQNEAWQNDASQNDVSQDDASPDDAPQGDKSPAYGYGYDHSYAFVFQNINA
jgi:hypothetical protein